MTLTTLRFHDEVRQSKDVPTPTKRDKPAKKEVDQAVVLIEALACPWDPSRYEDRYEKRLKKIVQRKRKGQTVEEPEREKEPAPVPDLMAALEQTLAEIKSG
jgi:DNA end-binding protein Ku